MVMKIIFFITALLVSSAVFSQQEGDTIYKRCPVAIKDTVTGNNYFIEHQPATVKTYRYHGNFTIDIEQKGQFFTIFFHTKKISTKGKYDIKASEGGRGDVNAKYSFKSGESVAFLNVISGKVETAFDKTTKLWHIKANGLIANMGGSGVSYFKATADFYIR
jgi:hypothetical protein